MAVDRDQLPKGIGRNVDVAGQLCRELELAGIEPLFTLDSDGMLCGDVTLLAPPVTTGQFRRQIIDILMQGLPLSVSLGPVAGHAGIMETLQEAADDAAAPLQRIQVAVQGAPALPDEYTRSGFAIHWLLQDMNREAWECLWASRNNPYLHGNYGAQVLPICPLLTVEPAAAVLPGTHLQVPAGTAWLQAGIDLSRFADDRGRVDEEMLNNSLRRCVEALERLHARVRWPTPKMRHDAWLNRRIAIVIGGLGDLVRKRELDPCRFSTLEEMARLLRRLRKVLRSQSRLIAERTRGLPALEHIDPAETLPGGRVRSNWRARWRDAVELASPRHRNLIAMSPWALFPAGRPADFRHADLLPLLRFSDVCALGRAPDISGWNMNEFKSFHCRAMAALQQRDAGHQIAEAI